MTTTTQWLDEQAQMIEFNVSTGRVLSLGTMPFGLRLMSVRNIGCGFSTIVVRVPAQADLTLQDLSYLFDANITEDCVNA